MKRLLLFVPLVLATLDATAAEVTRTERLNLDLKPASTVSHVVAQEITLRGEVSHIAHRHPCVVVGQVLEGEITFQIDGQAPVMLRAGDTFLEPAQTLIRQFDHHGEQPARFTAFYLIGPTVLSQPLIEMVD